MRLSVRIARELHMPITEVLQLPGHELALWAEVYRLEAGETEETPPEEVEVDPREVYKLLGGTVK